MSKKDNWIAGINAVASALEHDVEHVREVLIEAGGKNAAPDRDRGDRAPPRHLGAAHRRCMSLEASSARCATRA